MNIYLIALSIRLKRINPEKGWFLSRFFKFVYIYVFKQLTISKINISANSGIEVSRTPKGFTQTISNHPTLPMKTIPCRYLVSVYVFNLKLKL